MQVILLRDVEALGEPGTVVQVADGYARNYLLPKQYAVAATKGALKDLEARRGQLEAKAEKRYQEDLARAEAIEKVATLRIEVRAGEGGKLFGSVTSKDIVVLLKEQAQLDIERKNVLLSGPINHLGEHPVGVRLSRRVTANLTLVVISAEAEKQAAAAAARAAQLEQEQDEEEFDDELSSVIDEAFDEE